MQAFTLTQPRDLAAAIAASGAEARRYRRHRQHVVGRSGVDQRVIDPAGGSWYVESLTDALARSDVLPYLRIDRRQVAGDRRSHLQAFLDLLKHFQVGEL